MRFFFFITLLGLTFGAKAQTFHAYLYDDDTENPTNIRSAPGGEVIRTINQADDAGYFITCDKHKGGWFHISALSGLETDLDLKGDIGWIHGSVLMCDTRNYGGESIKLYSEPAGSTVVGSIEEQSGIRPVAFEGTWVKVKYGETVGWLEADWLCSNPVTTCP